MPNLSKRMKRLQTGLKVAFWDNPHAHSGFINKGFQAARMFAAIEGAKAVPGRWRDPNPKERNGIARLVIE